MLGNVVYEKQQGKVILKISGEFDSRLVRRFDDLVEELLKLGESNFVVDLAACKFMYSVGIGKIVSLSKKLDILGGELKVINPPPRIKKLFQLVKLDYILADGRD